MTELIAVLSKGQGTWGQVSGLIKKGEWKRQVEVAKLYNLLGDEKHVREIFDGAIKDGDYLKLPDYALEFLDSAVELTGDRSFLERKLPVFEEEGRFEEAAALAGELGRDDLKETYEAFI